MFFADYHMHTNFSSDCITPMIDMVERAYSMGLKEIAITDHIDFDYPDENYPFVYDYNKFIETINICQDLYKKKIKILCGVELGLQPHIQKEVDDFLLNSKFDFIIGSTHTVDKKELCVSDFFEGKSKSAAHSEYLDDVLNSIRNYDCFNVYGHIDFINRYGDYPDKSFLYNDHAQKIDEILNLLISKGKGIEINTSGFRYGVGAAHPQLNIVKRYKELGGEIITVGSDAHKVSDIACDFNIAYEMLEEAGFNYISLFRNKKPDFIKISNLK